jgi:hypothetical protein
MNETDNNNNNNNYSTTINSTQYPNTLVFDINAKVIVLGDDKTGKSSLIHNLDPRSRGRTLNDNNNEDNLNEEDMIFKVIEYPSSILDWTNLKSKPSSVYLKVWEYSDSIKNNEKNIIFSGTLICIITIDLCSPKTANSAFNKWLLWKEKHMPESFLFVIGTYTDLSAHRRVDIHEICKACTQKDAIYLEVSNTDGSNIELFQKLICQRLSYMLKVRESIQFLSDTNNKDEESEIIDKLNKSEDGQLNISYLERDLVCDSVGSILSSSLGIDYWPGFKAEEENLKKISSDIMSLIDNISNDSNLIPPDPKKYINNNSNNNYNNELEYPEPNIDELKILFETMGLTLPSTLSALDGNSFSNSTLNVPTEIKKTRKDDTKINDILNANKGIHTESKRIKLRVCLPDGSTADMILYGSGFDVEEQVDSFMIQYDFEENNNAREVLIGVARKAIGLPINKTSNPPTPPKSPPISSSSSSITSNQSTNNIPFNSTRSRSNSRNIIPGKELLNSPNTSQNILPKSIVKNKSNIIDQLPSTPITPFLDPNSNSNANNSNNHTTPSNINSQVKSASRLTSLSTSKNPKTRIKVKLPQNLGVIDTVIGQNEDLKIVSKRLSVQYGLSFHYEQKVFEQLKLSMSTTK